VVVLTTSSAVIQYVFEAQLAFLYSAAFIVPLVFGYSMSIRLPHSAGVALAVMYAALASAATVLALSMVPVVAGEATDWLPASDRDRREAAQFLIAIFAAYCAGIFAAQGVRAMYCDAAPLVVDRLHRWFLPEQFDSETFAGKVARFKEILLFIAAGVSALTSGLTAVHRLFGG
jgi:hypothetical protein